MATAVLTRERQRFHRLDALRGLAFVNMVVYHGLYDLVGLFGVSIPWFFAWPGRLWQQLIAGTLIFLAGVSCRLSHSNLRRGIRIFLCGCLLTAATLLVMPSQRILFGVLHFIGCGCILTGLLQRQLAKIPPLRGLAGSGFLFFLTRSVSAGVLALGSLELAKVPDALYRIPGFFALGFPGEGFSSSDYFPLFPWLFLLWAGFFFWGWIQSSERQGAFAGKPVPFLGLVGRHTLPVYLLHQPVIYGVLWLVFRLF